MDAPEDVELRRGLLHEPPVGAGARLRVRAAPAAELRERRGAPEARGRLRAEGLRERAEAAEVGGEALDGAREPCGGVGGSGLLGRGGQLPVVVFPRGRRLEAKGAGRGAWFGCSRAISAPMSSSRAAFGASEEGLGGPKHLRRWRSLLGKMTSHRHGGGMARASAIQMHIDEHSPRNGSPHSFRERLTRRLSAAVVPSCCAGGSETIPACKTCALTAKRQFTASGSSLIWNQLWCVFLSNDARPPGVVGLFSRRGLTAAEPTSQPPRERECSALGRHSPPPDCRKSVSSSPATTRIRRRVRLAQFFFFSLACRRTTRRFIRRRSWSLRDRRDQQSTAHRLLTIARTTITTAAKKSGGRRTWSPMQRTRRGSAR